LTRSSRADVCGSSDGAFGDYPGAFRFAPLSAVPFDPLLAIATREELQRRVDDHLALRLDILGRFEIRLKITFQA
jgi:hypothetical protein